MTTNLTKEYLHNSKVLERYINANGASATDDLTLVADGDTATLQRVAKATGLKVRQLRDMFDPAGEGARRDYRIDVIAKTARAHDATDSL